MHPSPRLRVFGLSSLDKKRDLTLLPSPLPNTIPRVPIRQAGMTENRMLVGDQLQRSQFNLHPGIDGAAGRQAELRFRLVGLVGIIVRWFFSAKPDGLELG